MRANPGDRCTDAGSPPLPYGSSAPSLAKLGPLYMGGTGARDAREIPAAELVRILAAEAELD